MKTIKKVSGKSLTERMDQRAFDLIEDVQAHFKKNHKSLRKYKDQMHYAPQKLAFEAWTIQRIANIEIILEELHDLFISEKFEPKSLKQVRTLLKKKK